MIFKIQNYEFLVLVVRMRFLTGRYKVPRYITNPRLKKAKPTDTETRCSKTIQPLLHGSQPVKKLNININIIKN